MATKRMTANDYAKELHKLELDKMALEKRIKTRAIELAQQYPDVEIHLSRFINPYKASSYEINKNTDTDSALAIIEGIEKYLAEQHPHKQIKIEFPITQHEKIMKIAKDIQAINIPKSEK